MNDVGKEVRNVSSQKTCGRCEEDLPRLFLRCMVTVWRVSLQPRFDWKRMIFEL